VNLPLHWHRTEVGELAGEQQIGATQRANHSQPTHLARVLVEARVE
jgi:hypothetical protein